MLIKKIICAAAAAVMSAVCVSGAYAQPQQYVSGYGGIKTEAVVFSGTDDEGRLVPGTAVTAGIKAVKPEGEPENAVFVLTLYKDKKMIGAAADTGIIGSEPLELSASMSIPADSGEYELNVSLISADSGFTPLSNPAFYPPREENKLLKAIYIGQETVEDFSPYTFSYKYIVGRTDTEYPLLEAQAADSGTKIDVSIDGEFPGEGVIKALSCDGTENTYTVDFKYRTHAVKGALKESDFIDDPDVTDGKMSRENVLTKAVGDNANSFKVFTNLRGYDTETKTTGSRWTTDLPANSPNYYTLHTVAGDLKGCDYMVTTSGTMANSGTYFEFELGADAEIIVLSTSAVNNLTGFSPDNGNGSEKFVEAYYINASFFNMFKPYGVTPEYSDAIMWTSQAKRDEARPILAEKYGVPESALTAGWATGGSNYLYRYSKQFAAGETVTIPAPDTAQGTNDRGYIVVIKAL